MHFPLPAPDFTFAGFSFPKFVFTLPRGTISERIARMRKRMVGPSYHSPKPSNAGSASFYFNADHMPNLRWEWCDEVNDVRIDHMGWYCDEDSSGGKIRGVVFRLPRQRGFIAGWSMGKGLSAGSEPHIYATEKEAAYAADRLAESIADNHRNRLDEIED